MQNILASTVGKSKVLLIKLVETLRHIDCLLISYVWNLNRQINYAVFIYYSLIFGWFCEVEQAPTTESFK